MAQAKLGDTVKVNYTGKLEDGSIFDSSECREDECSCGHEPLEFVIGEGNVIPGFEQAVIGMAPGDRKTVNLSVAESYGEQIEEMVAQMKLADLPADLTPEVGAQLEVTQEDGNSFPVLITAIDDKEVTLDANHPLAGRALTFDLELVEIS